MAIAVLDWKSDPVPHCPDRRVAATQLGDFVVRYSLACGGWMIDLPVGRGSEQWRRIHGEVYPTAGDAEHECHVFYNGWAEKHPA